MSQETVAYSAVLMKGCPNLEASTTTSQSLRQYFLSVLCSVWHWHQGLEPTT